MGGRTNRKLKGEEARGGVMKGDEVVRVGRRGGRDENEAKSSKSYEEGCFGEEVKGKG